MTVEQTIISATIECIERYGIQGTTNRRIAEIANLSNAAINYYFRTKDALIAQTLTITLENAFDFDNFENRSEDSPRQRCITIFDDLITGGLKYPNITRAHFYPILIEGKQTSEAATRLNTFVSQLADDLLTRDASLSRQDLSYGITQAVMSVMMAVMAPALFAPALHIDLTKPEHRQKFVLSLVDRLFCEVHNE